MKCGWGGGMKGYIIGAVFFIAVGFFIFLRRQRWLATVRQQVAAAQHWPEANARVDSTEAYRKPSVVDILNLFGQNVGMGMPTMMIAYRFDVGGEIYHGNRLAFGKLETAPRHARQTLERYPKGAVIRIRYNPQDPRDNVVEPRELVNAKADWVIGPMVMGLGAILFLIGLTKGH